MDFRLAELMSGIGRVDQIDPKLGEAAAEYLRAIAALASARQVLEAELARYASPPAVEIGGDQ